MKKFEVEISIIVGTYNEKKKNIEQLISSIINQKFKNYELIVIDDSDNAIIREFWQLELKKVPVSTYIKTGKKQPLAKACNFGVKHAKGEFIARIDSDDYMAAKDKAIKKAMSEDKNEVIARMQDLINYRR